MRRNPGFSAVAVLSLALGIGANLAVFGVLHRLVLTRLPVRDPDQLVQLVVMQANGAHYTNPFPKFAVMRDNFPVFKPLFGWGGFRRRVVAGEWKEQAQVVGVTGNYFEALGTQAEVGRLVTTDDEARRAADVAVISHDLWRAAFAGDPGAVGKTVKVDDAMFTIVGVTPQAFGGTEPGNPPAVYLPLHSYTRIAPQALQAPGLLWFHIMGRLTGEMPFSAVQTLLREQWARLDEPNRLRFTRNTHDYILLEDGSRGYSDVRRNFSAAVVVLMGIVVAVFLIACANLATLLFVRGAGRVREMGIRVALGAGRGHLVRQWMTECLLLAALGGAAGVLGARWITDLLLYFVAEADRPWLRFQARPLVLLLSVALTLAAGLLCGLLPGLRATTARPESTLRAQSGALTERRSAVAQGVLAAQLAVSLVLVVGAALFARTLWNLNTTTGGFDRKSVMYAIPTFGPETPRDRRGAVMADALERLRRSPLVAAASMGSPPMVWGDSGFGFVTQVQGYTFGPDEDNTAYNNGSLPGYFDVMRIPFVAGRDFEERDRPPAGQRSRVVIINERMARHYFSSRNPIGETIVVVNGRMEIVGVVKDTQNRNLREPGKDVTYTPAAVDGWGAIVARARPGVTAATLESEIRAAFAAAAKQVPLEIARIEDAVQKSIGRDRLVAQLSAAFGLLGILLASMGLYAAIAHSVTMRTREIGIRIAIGATPRDVTWMVLRQSLFVTGIGLLVGLPAAITAARLIGSLLFDVSPADPSTLAAASVGLAATGLAAGWWPARRAARLDPSHTLRLE